MVRSLIGLTLSCLLFGCRNSDSSLVARDRYGTIAVADLDVFVRSRAEQERRVPPGTDPNDWLVERLEDLGVKRHLEQAEETRAYLEGPQIQFKQRWALLVASTQSLLAQLGAEAPSDQEVAFPDESEEPAREPLISFRHIFFRLDRAQTEAEIRRIRSVAESVTKRAKHGEDFEQLAREYSTSANAASGGLVRSQRLSLLDERAAAVLDSLEEGKISRLLETRTGLHLFQLDRRVEVPAPSPEEQRTRAETRARRQTVAKRLESFAAELRNKINVQTERFPWQVGPWSLSEQEFGWAAAAFGGQPGEAQTKIERTLLFAAEAESRGLLIDSLENKIRAEIEAGARVQTLASRRRKWVDAMDPSRVRGFFEARPSAFMTPARASLGLIFIPQGKDVFGTQRKAEDLVARLRDRASFAAAAKEHSVHASALEGGDLGWMEPSQWAELQPQVYRAVNQMEPGDITDPIYCTPRLLTANPRTLRGGFAIVVVRERREPRQRSFEEAIDDIRRAYANQNRSEVESEVRAELLTESGFEILRSPRPEQFISNADAEAKEE